jgi:uncharacterized protein YdbL (DUF1318 family)
MLESRVNKLKISIFLCALVVLVSCVTINVYFPSAAAERAAEQFVEEVLGEKGDESSTFDPLHPPRNIIHLAAAGLLDFLVADAQAQQPDFKINTPQINAIKSRMAARQQQHLNGWFDAGAVGFSSDGLVSIRDRAAVPLSERRNLESVVAVENRDRKAVYREIAVANGHPEWEQQIQQTWSQEWIRNARPGWYYQKSDGSWTTK